MDRGSYDGSVSDGGGGVYGCGAVRSEPLGVCVLEREKGIE